MKRCITLVLLLSAIALPAYPFGQNKIVYDRFKWNVYHSTHFDIYFYDEERQTLQKVVDVAESAYDDLSRKLNFQISKKIPLIYYHTHSAFEQTNVDLNFIPEGVGAFAEPAKNRMVLPIDMTDEKLMQLVQHELTHIFEYELLFQGKLGKTITANPPLWLMEGLASFMAQDEDSKDRMVLRDAVVNDIVPRISRAQGGGYFAYRFGHAVFKYIQQKYGWEGLRDFIYEYRNTLGSSVEKALRRAFEVSPDEFDTRFRAWLRKQYLPALVSKGEPQAYGEPFRIGEDVESQEISPVPSPSGDLLVAFTTYKEDIDVVLFNIPERRMMKNLTSGYTAKYEYPIVQMMTTGPVMGRDVAFSPNGDQIALFVKKERGRQLMLLNALSGEIQLSKELRPVEQEINPTYSPDGRLIAFAGFNGAQPDIFVYDTVSGNVDNITNDKFFDAAPTFSPDGKWLIYSSQISGYAKLIKLNLANRTERYQLTTGEWNDIDAWYAPDGKRVFFASDKQTSRAMEDAQVIVDVVEAARSKAGRNVDAGPLDPTNFASYNIYSLNLENGDLLQYTDVVGGCFTPVVFTGQNNRERMVFASYYKTNWRLFSTATDKPLHEPVKTTLPTTPLVADTRPSFQPAVEVAVDEEKIERPDGFKLFVEDVSVNAGVTSDQLFVSRSSIYMSDMLGDRRFVASLDSVSSFSNFDFLYFDVRRRWNWGVRLFDSRDFFTTLSTNNPNEFERNELSRNTGLVGILSYPFTRYHRLDSGAGYVRRSINYPVAYTDNGGILTENVSDSYPFVSTSFSGDTTVFREFGPLSGHRYEVGGAFAGTLSRDLTLDARHYLQISSRTLIASRVFFGHSTGDQPNYYAFGGLNTVRGYPYGSIVGTQAGYANIEFRFPLVDILQLPFLRMDGIRGTFFLDVGGAKFPNQPYTFYEDGRLINGVASMGYGITFNFLGMEMHWDFATRTDLKDQYGQKQVEFWIGQTF